jgi:hypothetical protein
MGARTLVSETMGFVLALFSSHVPDRSLNK